MNRDPLLQRSAGCSPPRRSSRRRAPLRRTAASAACCSTTTPCAGSTTRTSGCSDRALGWGHDDFPVHEHPVRSRRNDRGFRARHHEDPRLHLRGTRASGFRRRRVASPTSDRPSSTPSATRAGMSLGEAAEALAIYRPRYLEMGAFDSTLFPGIAEVVRAVRAAESRCRWPPRNRRLRRPSC